MKKVLSFTVALVILVTSCCGVVFAKEKCDCGNAPVIYIEGQGETLYINEGQQDEKSVPYFDEAVLKNIPKLLFAMVWKGLTGNYDILADVLIESAKQIVDIIACDKDGNSKYDVTIRKRTYNYNNHAILEYVKSNNITTLPRDFDFTYDWRLDPVYNAQRLNDMIDNIKEATGHDKVIILAHSEGNNVLCSYLYQYGHDSVEKIICMSPAYQGLSIDGSLFAKEYNIYDKGDALGFFLGTVLKGAEKDAVTSLYSILNKLGVVDIILNDVQDLFNHIYEQKVYDYLMSVLGTMPGMWSFVPDEYYATAKKAAFEGKEGYDILIQKIDYFHYNVQNKAAKLLEDAMNDGVDVSIIAGYGISTIPVSNSAPEHSDLMINTRFMSLGATCAPLGETFADDYVQKVNDGHGHLSPDMMIDASTCKFPEITWFIRDMTHSEMPDCYCQFLAKLCLYDGQPKVDSFPEYSQFMAYENDSFVKITGKKETVKKNDILTLFSALFALLKGEK